MYDHVTDDQHCIIIQPSTKNNKKIIIIMYILNVDVIAIRSCILATACMHPPRNRPESIMLRNLPIMLLAFPKFFDYYAHFYAPQIYIMQTIFADYGEN